MKNGGIRALINSRLDLILPSSLAFLLIFCNVAVLTELISKMLYLCTNRPLELLPPDVPPQCLQLRPDIHSFRIPVLLKVSPEGPALFWKDKRQAHGLVHPLDVMNPLVGRELFYCFTFPPSKYLVPTLWLLPCIQIYCDYFQGTE